MDLLDRYLQAVKKHLPWQRQDDILAELRANLESQLEDKETELGRPLTMGEAEDWLRQIGPPMRVAARYMPQQYLIGPAIFPTYWFTLKMVFFWAAMIYMAVSAVLIATLTPSWMDVLEAALRVPVILMTAAAWVTLIFAALEFATTHYPEKFKRTAVPSVNWSPSALPPVEKEAARGNRPRSYAHAVAEVAFGALFLIWFLLVPHYPYLLLGPGAAYLSASPFVMGHVWVQVYWWIVALNLLQLIWRCVAIYRGKWQQPRNAERLVISILGLIPLDILLFAARDHAYVLLKHPALDMARYGGALDSINNAIYRVTLFLCVAIGVQLLWRIVRQFLKAHRRRAAAVR
jgi:hypothetical protein